MVYVTHDQDEALALGHRVAVLDAGSSAGRDARRGLRPAANRFVASFVGSRR
jgi:multiple sugar transport system ATP-binding protein